MNISTRIVFICALGATAAATYGLYPWEGSPSPATTTTAALRRGEVRRIDESFKPRLAATQTGGSTLGYSQYHPPETRGPSSSDDTHSVRRSDAADRD